MSDTSGVLNLREWESISKILNYHEAAECAVSNMLLYQLEADGLSWKGIVSLLMEMCSMLTGIPR